MAEQTSRTGAARRLSEILDLGLLEGPERESAEQALRRLVSPLRLTIFSTDTRHAVSLLNLMVGQSVISPKIEVARLQFVFANEPYANLYFRDGSQRKIPGDAFGNIFEDDPVRVRIGVPLPVLEKLSILVVAQSDTVRLAEEAGKTVAPADISLWAGDAPDEALLTVWAELPERLKDHSYLVLSPSMDPANWAAIRHEFADVLIVDPRLAQAAKERKSGVDKDGFRKAGGTAIVKAMKKEIDLLVRASLDAADVLGVRYGDALPSAKSDARPSESNRSRSQMSAAPVQGNAVPTASAPIEEASAAAAPAPVSRPVTEPIIPGVDVAIHRRLRERLSRPREDTVPTDAKPEDNDIAPTVRDEAEVHVERPVRTRQVSQMVGKARSTPGSKVVPKARVVSRAVVQSAQPGGMKRVSRMGPKSRKNRPSATPWSLGI